MTGVELAIQLNKERPDTKILPISGLNSGMLVLNNGWQFLSKPFAAGLLRDRIRDFLSEQVPIRAHVPEYVKKAQHTPRRSGREAAENQQFSRSHVLKASRWRTMPLRE